MGHALRKALGVIAVVQGRGQAAGTAVVADGGSAAAGRLQPEGGAGCGLGRPGRPGPGPGPGPGVPRSGRGLRRRPGRGPGRGRGGGGGPPGPRPGRRPGRAGAVAAPRGGPRPADQRRGRRDAPRPQVPLGAVRRLQAARGARPGHRPGARRGHHPCQRARGQRHRRIAADLDAAGRHLAELHIDRAYLASALVRDRGPDLAIFCKAWRVRKPAAATPRTSSPSTSPPGS